MGVYRRIFLLIILLFLGLFNILSVTAQINDESIHHIFEEKSSLKTFGKGKAETVIWSSDEKMLAVKSSIGIWLYAIEDGELVYLHQINGSFDDVLIFSSDNHYLAMVEYHPQQHLIIWDIQVQQSSRSWELETDYYASQIAFSPDNQIISLTSRNKLLSWNISSGEQIGNWLFYAVHQIMYQPDNELIVGGIKEENDKWGIWNLTTINANTVDALTSYTSNYIFAYLGETPLVAYKNRGNDLIEIVDLKTNEVIDRFKPPSFVQSAWFTQDATQLIVIHREGVSIWNVETQEVFEISLKENISDIWVNTQATQIAFLDGTDIRFQEISSGNQIGLLEEYYGLVDAMEFSHENYDLAVVYRPTYEGSTYIRLWDTATSDLDFYDLEVDNNIDRITTLSFTRDHNLIYGHSFRPIYFEIIQKNLVSGEIINIAKYDCIESCELADFIVNDNKIILTIRFTTFAQTYRYFDYGYIVPLNELINFNFEEMGANFPLEFVDGLNQFELIMDINPQGIIARNYKLDNSIQLLSIEGSSIGFLEGHQSKIKGLSFNPDGTILVSGDDTGNIIVWDVAQQEILQTINISNDSIEAIEFNPVEASFAVATNNKISLINMDNGATISMEHSNVTEISFSFNGELLATANRQGEIRLWDIN